MAYIPLRKAVEFLGMHPNTLRKYADEGKIKSIKNEAGQRLYDVESYRRDSVEPATLLSQTFLQLPFPWKVMPCRW
jgi:predicted site-specific integrase-resolvase